MKKFLYFSIAVIFSLPLYAQYEEVKPGPPGKQGMNIDSTDVRQHQMEETTLGTGATSKEKRDEMVPTNPAAKPRKDSKSGKRPESLQHRATEDKN